jgi:predicted enzyme related to lactoylglutathione lyase
VSRNRSGLSLTGSPIRHHFGVAARLTEIIIDASDPRRLARFWGEVLGWPVIDDDRGLSWISATGDYTARPMIVFVPVPEAKTVKNRVHLDVNPSGNEQTVELERLLALGATRVDVGQSDAVPWVVLADPEGNEFCLLARRTD